MKNNIGDSLVQKWFTPDELPLKHQKNKGEISQYYIKNSHPAIISREILKLCNSFSNKEWSNTFQKQLSAVSLSAELCSAPFAVQPFSAVPTLKLFGGHAISICKVKSYAR